MVQSLPRIDLNEYQSEGASLQRTLSEHSGSEVAASRLPLVARVLAAAVATEPVDFDSVAVAAAAAVVVAAAAAAAVVVAGLPLELVAAAVAAVLERLLER